MKPADLVDLLVALYREKDGLRRRHTAGARLVRGYDANNSYQYVIAREDVHLAWLADAIVDLGGVVPTAAVESGVPDNEAAIFLADLDAIQAFLGRWQDRVTAVTNARHRLMLSLLVGETREQARLFEQAVEGRTDLLGHRTAPSPPTGAVLPTRWVE